MTYHEPQLVSLILNFGHY